MAAEYPDLLILMFGDSQDELREWSAGGLWFGAVGL